MSLARMILRIAAARALVGATLADDRIFDSAIDPLDQRVTSNHKPVIVIYTDDHEEATTGRAHMLGGESSCDLVIEIAVAGLVTVEIPPEDGGGLGTEISIPTTDAGMEFTLDMIERQAVAALTAGTGIWAEIWRDFCVTVRHRVSRRGSSADNGSRFAARQITLTCDLLIDPAPGGPLAPGSSWEKFVNAVTADTDMAPLAPLFRDAICGAPLSDWRRAAADLGIHQAVAVAIGIGPISGLGDEPSLLGEITVAGTPILPPPIEPVFDGWTPPTVPTPFSLMQYISADGGNYLAVGNDGRLFVPQTGGIDTDPGDFTLIFDNHLI